MRFYSFTNYYLSSIQIGIQTAHAVGEMSLKYQHIPGFETGPTEIFNDWVRNHKTLICLNGGNNADLTALYALLTSEDNPGYPVAKFNEDDASMAGMLTSVGIVLPARLYDAEWIKPGPNNDVGYWWYDSADKTLGMQILGWEAELLTVLKRLPLAR